MKTVFALFLATLLSGSLFEVVPAEGLVVVCTEECAPVNSPTGTD